MKRLHLFTTLITFTFFASSSNAQQKIKGLEFPNHLVILVGASFNSYHVKGSDKNIAPAGSKFDAAVSPVVAISYITKMGSEFSRFFFYPQLKFSAFKNTGNQVIFLNNGSPYQLVTTTEKASLLVDAIPGFGYHVTAPGKNFMLSVSAGPGIAILLGSKQEQIQQHAITGMITTSETNGRGVSYNLSFEARATFHSRYIVWISSGTPTTTTDYSLYSGRLSSTQGGVGYVF